MIGLNHYRAVSLCLLATIFLVACTRRQQFWASPTVREIEEVKSRTVPSNGSLLRESGPIRDTSGRLNIDLLKSGGSQLAAVFVLFERPGDAANPKEHALTDLG